MRPHALLRTRIARSRLRDAALDPTTLERYNIAIQQFWEWAEEEGRKGTITTSNELDRALEDWWDYLCFEVASTRGNLARLIKARAGLIHMHPHLKTRLPNTLLAIKGWERLAPTTQRPPAPRFLVFALTRYFVERNQRQMALLIYLCFDCFLRINEALRLTSQDINTNATGPDGEAVTAILLKKTKTGLNQSVTVLRPELVQEVSRRLVQVAKEGLANGQKIFVISAYTFNQQLKKALKELGVDMQLTAHSLRHGGATAARLDGWQIQDVMHRGR